MRTARGRHLTKTIIAQASHVLAVCVVSIISPCRSLRRRSPVFQLLIASITFIFNFCISWRPVMCPFGLLCASCGMHIGGTLVEGPPHTLQSLKTKNLAQALISVTLRQSPHFFSLAYSRLPSKTTLRHGKPQAFDLVGQVPVHTCY